MLSPRNLLPVRYTQIPGIITTVKNGGITLMAITLVMSLIFLMLRKKIINAQILTYW